MTPVVIICALSVPASAWAADVYVTGAGAAQVLHFDAHPGEVNSIDLSRAVSSGTDYYFINGGPITPGAGCQQSGADGVACPSAGIASADVLLGDMGDSFFETAGDVLTIPVHIDAGSGDDYVTGWSSGVDTVDLGDGNDTFELSSQGADDVHGGAGHDVVRTPSNANPGQTIYTSLDDVANDGEIGGTRNIHSDFERVEGGPEPDVIVGSSGADELLGDVGSDEIHGGGGADTIDGGDGYCDSDSDQLYGDSGNDTIHLGNPGTANGGADNDTLDLLLGCGGETISGGPGADTADMSGTPWRTTVSFDGVANDTTENSLSKPDNFEPDFETIIGTSHDDAITGSALAETIDGGAGDDVIDGGGGADVMSGGPGFDFAEYGNRSESVTIDLDGDHGDDGAAGEGDSIGTDFEGLHGGSGNDSLTGGPGDNILDGGLGSDVIAGGDGNDLVDYSSRTAKVWATLTGLPGDDGEAGEGDTLASDVESVFSGSGPDELAANPAGNSYMFGGPGDDHLVGAGSYDQLWGGDGSDTIDGGPGFDEVFGDSGDDRINVDDGTPEKPRCGDGNDTVKEDTTDQAAADCENVDGGQVQNPGTPSPPVSTPKSTAPIFKPASGVPPVGFFGRLIVAKRSLKGILGVGPAFRVRCTVFCASLITASISGEVAKRVGLSSDGKPYVIARAIHVTANSQDYGLAAPLTPLARKRLARAGKLIITYRMIARDPWGRWLTSTKIGIYSKRR